MAPTKRITSADVAVEAGVSRTTVSFVLNGTPGKTIPDETRQRVFEAARRLDYKPHALARALAAGRSDIVLLAIPDLPMGASIPRFIEQLATALAGTGLTLVTHLAGAHGRALPDVCAAVGATAVVGFEPFDAETIDALHRAGAAVVVPSPGDDHTAIGRIGRMQAEHLIDRGHRRLGYALPPARSGLEPMAQQRLRGAAAACAAASLQPPVAVRTGLEPGAAAQAVARWRAESVTGVCAFNDETAIAVLAGIREQGLAVPADLAVIGSDDVPTAGLQVPPLTTVSIDLGAAARLNAELVAAGLAGRAPSMTEAAATLPRIIRRAST